jgi:ribosomal protein S18 acetylase RimI-like enzyme
VYELLQARDRAAFGRVQVERGHVERAWTLADNWVAEAEGRIVGHASLDSAQELALAAADDATADALLAAAEDRARERGFARLTATVVPEDEPFARLVGRSGFVQQREVLRMWRRLNGEPPARSVDGVAIRTYGHTDAHRVHALLDEAYAGWDRDYVRRSHVEWLAWMTEHDEFDPTLWFVAERDGELVGCALHWREHRRSGWVKDIVVREDVRGRGLARALLEHGFCAYAARGVERVGLKVDSTNPTGALQLYERAGFATDRRYRVCAKLL